MAVREWATARRRSRQNNSGKDPIAPGGFPGFLFAAANPSGDAGKMLEAGIFASHMASAASAQACGGNTGFYKKCKQKCKKFRLAF